MSKIGEDKITASDKAESRQMAYDAKTMSDEQLFQKYGLTAAAAVREGFGVQNAELSEYTKEEQDVDKMLEMAQDAEEPVEAEPVEEQDADELEDDTLE